MPLLAARSRLEIRTDAGLVVGTNDDWGASANRPALTAATTAAGAFALASGSQDAALLTKLNVTNDPALEEARRQVEIAMLGANIESRRR